MPAPYFNVPPPKLIVPLAPSAPGVLAMRVPPLTFTPPVKVLVPASVQVLVLALVIVIAADPLAIVPTI